MNFVVTNVEVATAGGGGNTSYSLSSGFVAEGWVLPNEYDSSMGVLVGRLTSPYEC
jgi:hypothetical protein